MATRAIQQTTGGLNAYNLEQGIQPAPTPPQFDPYEYAGVALAQPPPTQNADSYPLRSDRLQNLEAALCPPEEEQPPVPGVESVGGGTLAEPGLYDDGTAITYDPFQPPMGAGFSNRDLNAWFAQFTPGTRDQANAQFSLDWQMGTGQFTDMKWDPFTQSYVAGPDAQGQAGNGAGTPTALPGPDEAAGAGGQDADVMAAFQDYISESETRRADDTAAADARMQSLTDQFTASTEAAAAQQQQMMTLMMGLMGNRREEDEGRGSFTYNALGGR